MAERINLREGMQVFDTSNQSYGTIERVSGNQFYIQGKAFPLSSVARVEGNTVYLTNALGSADQGEVVLPVVEEELQVGKREVQTGGVRVTTEVTEKPAEAQVSLRDEEVRVERRRVNRPISEADLAALKDEVIEVTETDEQAVVNKRARVVEEVVIDKQVQERTETIRDTVRRTEVEVQKLAAMASNQSASNFADYEAAFRQNYQTYYTRSGYTYEQYRPVYQYGSSLVNDPRYQGKDWSTIEKDVRQDWEKRNPGTWDEFKDSVHYAWDKVRGQA
jgi:uncharacterized protein (TIGR02271 family)